MEFQTLTTEFMLKETGVAHCLLINLYVCTDGQGNRVWLICHLIWQSVPIMGPPKQTKDVLVSVPVRVATFSLPCQRQPATQTNPACSQPFSSWAIQRQAVESANPTHLLCVSLLKQLVKPIPRWAPAPAVEPGLARELNAHMFLQAPSDIANTSWQVANHSEPSHKAFGFDYMKRLWWKGVILFSKAVCGIWLRILGTAQRPCLTE